MEQQSSPVKSYKPKVSLSTVGIRVKKDTKKRILAELAKINKKEFGRKVQPDSLITLLLGLLKSEHIQVLQESSLTNEDRFERHYVEYVKHNGPTTKDQFLGALMGGSGIASPRVVEPKNA